MRIHKGTLPSLGWLNGKLPPEKVDILRGEVDVYCRELFLAERTSCAKKQE